MLVSDSGQKATVGVMFPERNDSFDFIQGLDNFKKAYAAEKGLDKKTTGSRESKIDAKIAANLSLKDGESMTLNIAGVTKSSGPGSNL